MNLHIAGESRKSFAHSETHDTTHQLALALSYAAANIPVFPVCPHSKKPGKGSRGMLDATTDEATIRRWWKDWPEALVSIPTGERSGFVVLDVDGALGLASLSSLIGKLGLEHVADLTSTLGLTPGGGLHLYFRFEPGTEPRTRASDIGACLDSRGLGGSIIVPGNVLPDGRKYELVDAACPAGVYSRAALNVVPTGLTLVDGPTPSPLPRSLLYLTTFKASDRDLIRSDAALLAAMRQVEPRAWSSILQKHRDVEASRIAQRCPNHEDNADGMRRQALHDLRVTATDFAALQDGRRDKFFSLCCRLARYVSHNVLSEAEVSGAMVDAARANGALSAHGIGWARGTIKRALAAGRNDSLPPLARAFRSERADA